MTDSLTYNKIIQMTRVTQQNLSLFYQNLQCLIYFQESISSI